MVLRLDSSFELAFRRALFSLLLLLSYLLLTSLLLSLIGQIEWAKGRAEAARDPREMRRSRRMDFERTELLNTLWAESVAARSESEWSMVANAKLDVYERLLSSESTSSSSLSHGVSCPVQSSEYSSTPWTFPDTFRSSLLAVITMGGGPLTDLSPEYHGPFTKLFSTLFALLGIPLALIHIGHCVKALSALINANFRSAPLALLAIFAGIVLVTAIVIDIVLVEDEEDENETSFLDSLFIVLLAFTTISGRSLNRLSAFLLLPLSHLLLTVSGALISTIQRSIERWIAPHEFAFANGFCGKIERAVSGERLDEADDDQAEFGDQQPPNGGNRSVKFLFGGGSSDRSDGPGQKLLANNNTIVSDHSLLMPPGRNIVGETIREESEHSSAVGDDDNEEEEFRGEMMPEVVEE